MACDADWKFPLSGSWGHPVKQQASRIGRTFDCILPLKEGRDGIQRSSQSGITRLGAMMPWNAWTSTGWTSDGWTSDGWTSEG